MPTLRQLLVTSLNHLRETGKQSLAVDDEARVILRDWMLRAHEARRRGAAPTSDSAEPVTVLAPMTAPSASAPFAAAPAAAAPAGRPSAAGGPHPMVETMAQPLTEPSRGSTAINDAPAPSDSRQHGAPSSPPRIRPEEPCLECSEAQAETPKFPAPDTERQSPPHRDVPVPQTVEEKLAYLRERAAHWAAVKRLGSLRDIMVFATGNPHARLMLVGEAPGHDEEEQREPFVGPAGRKLNDILRAMGLQRADVYISNICKYRPSTGPRQGTGNRPPDEREIAACLPIILAEIRAIRPACIVCLGGTAAKGLLGSAGSVSSLRGHWQECQGVPVRVTYHPSYLLRNESRSARRAVWEDMLAVMVKLGMPISERQQRYFL